MKEEEWASTDVWADVLGMVPLPLSVRKLQLWIIAICRLGWNERDPSELIYVMDQIEKFVDGSISHQECVRAIDFADYILDQEKHNHIAEILSNIHYCQIGDLYPIFRTTRAGLWWNYFPGINRRA